MRWLAVGILLLCYGCSSDPGRPKSAGFGMQPPSGSPNDELYREQRKKRQGYTESATITACQSSCYSLAADLTHRFTDDGARVFVKQIHFPNGGYKAFDGAIIPGSGSDNQGRDWSFTW
jgi:hypothetical protein